MIKIALDLIPQIFGLLLYDDQSRLARTCKTYYLIWKKAFPAYSQVVKKVSYITERHVQTRGSLCHNYYLPGYYSILRFKTGTNWNEYAYIETDEPMKNAIYFEYNAVTIYRKFMSFCMYFEKLQGFSDEFVVDEQLYPINCLNIDCIKIGRVQAIEIKFVITDKNEYVQIPQQHGYLYFTLKNLIELILENIVKHPQLEEMSKVFNARLL